MQRGNRFRGGPHRGGGGGGPRPPVKVGDELDVTIEAVGEKGDGIARKDGFVLFVPGVKEGDQVRVRVTRVLRKVGFAEAIGAEGASAPAEEEEAPEEPEESEEEAPVEEEAPAEESEEMPEEEAPVEEEAPAEESPEEDLAPPEPPDGEDSETFGEEDES